MAPYDNMMASPDVSEDENQQLIQLRKAPYPFILRDKIEKGMIFVRELARISFDEWQLNNTPTSARL